MNLASLDQDLGVLWVGLLRHLWQSTLIVLPLFLVARALRSAPARWSHRLWIAALAKLFIPLALLGPWVLGLIQRFAAHRAPLMPIASSLGYRVFITVIGVEGGGATPAADRIPAPSWILGTALYLAIATWLLVRLGVDVTAAWRLGRDGLPLGCDSPSRLQDAAAMAGVPIDRIVVTTSSVIPAVVGTFQPRIVIPQRLIGTLQADELQAVLLHEDMHRRHFDPAMALLQRTVSALLFFFPLIPFIQRRLLEAAELRCDEGALHAGAEPGAYVRALARTIGGGLDPSPTFAAFGDGSPSLVARRIERLGEPMRTKTMTKHRIAIALAVAILAAGVLLPVGPAGFLAGAATASDVPYTIVKQWNIEPIDVQNGGYGRIIVVDPALRNEKGLRTLAEQLQRVTAGDRNAAVYVYDDSAAAMLWKDAGNEHLDKADATLHDAHMIAIYSRSERHGRHSVELFLQGAGGPHKEIALPGDSPYGALDRLENIDRRVTLHIEHASAAKALEAIAAAADVHLSMEGSAESSLVTLKLDDATVRRVLEAIASQTHAHYEVIDSKSLFVMLPSGLLFPPGVTPPQIQTKVEPIYPKDAIAARAEGGVYLQVAIREDGTVGEIEVRQHADGWASLDDAAVKAVSQWTYSPAMQDGRPVKVVCVVLVEFRLDAEHSKE
jgi:TonB family protein